MPDDTQHTETPAPRPNSRASWLDPKMIVPFVQTLVLLLVGWWIKDSVSLALTQKQLDLANLSEMRTLVAELLERDQSPEHYRSAAVALAPFGTYTITTFLQLEQEGTDNQQLACEAGLRAVALREPKAVAEQLRRIVRNRTGFYTYDAHLFAIRTLGIMDTRESLPDLEAYHARLAQAASDSVRLRILRSIVSQNNAPGEMELPVLMASLEASIGALRQGRGDRP